MTDKMPPTSANSFDMNKAIPITPGRFETSQSKCLPAKSTPLLNKKLYTATPTLKLKSEACTESNQKTKVTLLSDVKVDYSREKLATILKNSTNVKRCNISSHDIKNDFPELVATTSEVKKNIKPLKSFFF